LDNEVRKDTTSILATKIDECKAHQTYPEELKPDRFNHFSSLNRLKRCIVCIHRVIKRLRSNKQYNWHPKGGPPTVQELSQAEKVVLRSLQHNHFESVIITLSELDGNESQFQEHQTARKRNKIVMLSSNLHKLDPFVDEEGLLRVGGRLKSSTSPYDVKHPLIVPKNSHVTSLLVRQFHHGKQHHQGYGMTHNAIHQAGFHIINGRSVSSHIITKCVVCRKLRGRSQDQKMADLPSERVTPAPHLHTLEWTFSVPSTSRKAGRS